MKQPALALFLCAFLFSGCGAANATNPEDVLVGNRAPDFSLVSLDGSTVKSSSFQSDLVVLNFWATWCQPCMSEIPELKEFAANPRVKVIGIALDQEGLRAVKPFVENNRINYTVLLGDEETFQQFNGLGIPYTLVLDRSHRIVKIYRGPATRESLEHDLKLIEQGA